MLDSATGAESVPEQKAEVRDRAIQGAEERAGLCVRTRTNHHGGILGGMASGMPVVFGVAFKPTPSISKNQDSVDLKRMEEVVLSVGGRHDACIAVRGVPCVEAAAAIAVTDCLLSEEEQGFGKKEDSRDRWNAPAMKDMRKSSNCNMHSLSQIGDLWGTETKSDRLSDNSKLLAELRRCLDEIDDEMTDLFSRRQCLAGQIGQIKRAEGASLFCPEREDQVRNRAIARAAQSGGDEEDAVCLMNFLMERSKNRQR